MDNQHSHWEHHFSRVVKWEGEEYLQLICELDGVIFQEIKITYGT